MWAPSPSPSRLCHWPCPSSRALVSTNASASVDIHHAVFSRPSQARRAALMDVFTLSAQVVFWFVRLALLHSLPRIIARGGPSLPHSQWRAPCLGDSSPCDEFLLRRRCQCSCRAPRCRRGGCGTVRTRTRSRSWDTHKASRPSLGRPAWFATQNSRFTVSDSGKLVH